MSTIGIIGGGPGGLALAHEAVRQGHSVTLFEAAPELGGLARSFQLGDIRIERYYHFICREDTGYFRTLDELAIDDQLEWRRTSMGFFYRGRLFRFASPLDLLRFDGISLAARIRYGMFIAYCSRLTRWRRLDAIPAEQWLVRSLGRSAYVATWYPLLEMKFGQFHDRISAAWVWHRIHRVARSRKTPFHAERLGYLRRGTESLVEELVKFLEKRGVTLRSGTPVRRIVLDGKRVVGIQTGDGTQWQFDYVVSAVPLPVFLRMTPELPEDYRKDLEAIDFLGVICVVLRLRHPLTDHFWLNVNDDRVPFNGCIEYTNLNGQMTPDGSAILYVPYYLPRTHERFSRSDGELFEECIAALSAIRSDFTREWVIDWAVSKDPYAQAVCTTGFGDRVPGHETPIENLFLIDSTQLYPSDRTIGGTLDLAHAVAQKLKERVVTVARKT